MKPLGVRMALVPVHWHCSYVLARSRSPVHLQPIALPSTRIASSISSSFPSNSAEPNPSCQDRASTIRRRNWDGWSCQYPEPHPWSAFEEDTDTVADGLLNVSIPFVDGRSAPLRTLLSFPSSSYDAAKTFAEETWQNVLASASLRVFLMHAEGVSR